LGSEEKGVIPRTFSMCKIMKEVIFVQPDGSKVTFVEVRPTPKENAKLEKPRQGIHSEKGSAEKRARLNAFIEFNKN
jgi:hypothetical protein